MELNVNQLILTKAHLKKTFSVIYSTIHHASFRILFQESECVSECARGQRERESVCVQVERKRERE